MKKTESVAAVAKHLGITERHVRRLSSEGKLPVITDKTMPLLDSLVAFIAYLKHQQSSAAITDAKRRKLEADAKLRELDLAERERQLIPAEAFSMFWAGLWIPVRTALVNLGERIGRDVVAIGPDPDKVGLFIEDSIRATLTEMSKFNEKEFFRRLDKNLDVGSGENLSDYYANEETEPKT